MSPATAAPPPRLAPPAAPGWLFGPSDLVCVAGLYWPLVVLVFAAGLPVEGPLTFVQLYFLSSPHRWITLPLVFLDRDRVRQQPGKLAAVGLGLLALGGCLWAASAVYPGAAHPLVVFMMADYVWNAWHFAAQHAGVGRIYARAAKVSQTAAQVEFEKSAVRGLVLWTFLRLALSTAGQMSDLPLSGFADLSRWLAWLDPAAVAPAAVVLGRAVVGGGPGRVAYLGSVVSLYSCVLAGLTWCDPAVVRGLFLAVALVHAGEYLTVCFWAVRKKPATAWPAAARTGRALAGFVVAVGVGNWLLFAWDPFAWAVVTLFVSLLHYGYDGMIWKAPKPAAATPRP